MPRLLYVESSPRKDRSASIPLARAYVDAWREAHPDGEVDELDVWTADLPEVDGDALEAKYAGIAGEERSPGQEEQWERFTAEARRFRDADVLLVGVPMWNYSIPYKLKQLIDVVTHADLLFEIDAEHGNRGLLDIPAVVVDTRGQQYGEGTPYPYDVWEQQTPVIDVWLRSIGITDVTHVVAEGTIGADEDAFDAQREELRTLARR